jgi:signal transduction histidine kinase
MTLEPAPVLPGEARPGGDDARMRALARQQWHGRRDLERQLHDGAALRISALTLRLGLLRHAMAAGEHDLRVTVEDLQDELHLVLQELRDVAGRLYPPLLDEAGLGPALREVAGRAGVRLRVDGVDDRFGAAVEGAVYFALLGCLTDASADRPVDVVIRRDGGHLAVLVTGVDACHAASIHDGVRLLGGTVAVGGAPDGAPDGAPPAVAVHPASITVRIPCA